MAKILVVDDEQAVCDMLKKFLQRKGHEALIALSGEEALKIVKEEKPDVILLDLIMPNMDGVETLKRIKKIDKRVGVVVITAIRGEDTAKECMRLGAFDYITKPLSLDYLESVLAVKLLDFL
ncbi:MAG: response regulator [Pseudomonadota bacterium]